jgi:hypothetical protein
MGRMTTLSIILIAMLGFLFALIVWAIIGTIRENRAINRGEIPRRQCFACTRRWMFEDSRRNLNVIGLRRYIEMNEIEICEYRRKELYGEDEK